MTCTALISAAGLALAVLPPASSRCLPQPVPGRLVGISIEVDGRPVPLHPARDGSGRWYLEARRESSYAIRLDNRSGERVGVELRVDGLDVISGEAPSPVGRGRLYILSPGSSTLIRGWRSSLEAVQRFEFVDERSSYAARASKAGARLGWIEARVFRQLRHARVSEPPPPVTALPPAQRREAEDSSSRREGRPQAEARSHPGTGWGAQLGDRAVVVDFEAEPAPAESIAVRYEYADALLALGVLPRCDPWWRLRQRERGETGFAKPPHH